MRYLAKAIFYKDKTPWYCGVSNYILHPEYYDNVFNTLALVYLSCDVDDGYWNPINWPVHEGVYENVYTFGLTDSHQRIQQVSSKMERVNEIDCQGFYKEQALDFTSLQPTHSVCYKVSKSMKQCLSDSGRALTTKSGNAWILIGISIFGPGCSLPSRYIEFFPYLPWIRSSIPIKTREKYRRTNYEYEQGMEEPYEDMDTFLLSKISDNTIVMRPDLAYVKENVYGKCDSIDGILMYREYGTIKAPGHTAVGVYSVSMYDLFFPNITCVMVTVMCNKRSETRFWFDTGFHQEDILDYVKIISIPKRNKIKAPKIMFIKDTYSRYRKIKTLNLDFKFEFTDLARMDLEFFGPNVSNRISSSFFTPLQSLRNLQNTIKLTRTYEEKKSEIIKEDDPFYVF
ncbi:uncharacterized protein [Epargyreus clarus]|uniref:uncharacterized protein n=1 Tax=Epargyreus clarus TaxID=520877 RepID=UPI003C2D2966